MFNDSSSKVRRLMRAVMPVTPPPPPPYFRSSLALRLTRLSPLLILATVALAALAVLTVNQAPPAHAQAQSTDATLSALTGRTSLDGSTAARVLSLVPAFAAATEDYIATVPNNVTHVDVTPTANHASATIEAGKGTSLTAVSSGSATSWIALDVGANEINVKVTAQDGTTTKTYTIVVTRASTDTLVSNVGQLKQAEATALTDTQANAFTTGSNAAGYTLTGIDFHVRATSSLTATHLGTLTASVWTASGSTPSGSGITALGTKLADLTVPTSATTGVVAFAAPAGTTLAANTTYYVAIGSTTFTGDPNLQINTTTSDNEDAGKVPGFSIANVSYSSGLAPWAQNGSSVALAFRVRGAAKTGGVTVSESSLAIAGTGTATYTVVLKSQPTASVTIAATSGTPAAATVSPASRTFTTTNWNTPQMFTVTGVAAGWSTITHAGTSTEANYNGIIGPPVAVRVDPANTVTLVGNTGQRVALAPSIDKKITNAFTTGSNAAGYTLSSIGFELRVGAPLTTTDKTALKAQLWSDSSGDPGTKVADLTAPTDIMTGVVYFAAPSNTTLTASTTYHVLIEGGGKPSVVTTETNNEDAGGAAGWSIADVYQFLNTMNVWEDHQFSEELKFQIRGAAKTATPPTTLTLTTNAASNTIAENGGSVTVTATLNRAATTAVSVTLTATGTATATADYSLPAAFTIAVGQTSGTGTVSIVNDDIDEANETVILTTTVSGLTVTPVTLTITDNDTAGVTVSHTTRSVQEDATVTYTVRLNSRPTANVVVGATSGTPGKATVSPASRTFTPPNWNRPQTFTVRGVAAGSSTITHAATSTDPKYPSSLSIGSVTVTVTDPTTTTTTPTGTLSTLTASMSTDPVREDWETNDLWSPTLTARELRSATASAPAIVGCDDSNASARCSSALSDNDFTFNGVAYTVKAISYNQRKVAVDTSTFQVKTYEESLKLTLDKAIPESLQSCLTLHSGNARIPFADDGLDGAGVDAKLSDSDRTLTVTAIGALNAGDLGWGLNWSAGQTVQLRLPNVGCLTLTLREAVTEETSLQWRLGGTADSSDYQRISLPTFAAGTTTASTPVKPVDDSEAENCETIKLDMTMWPGTDKAVHASYTVAINDNDGGNPCVGGM